MRSSALFFLTIIILAGFGVSVYIILKIPEDKEQDRTGQPEIKTPLEKIQPEHEEPEKIIQPEQTEQPEEPSVKVTEKKDILPAPYGFGIPEWVKVGVIGIAFASPERKDISRSKEAAKELAEDIHKKLKSRILAFHEAAKKHSDHPSSEKEGDLGFRKIKEITNLPGSTLVPGLKPGEISSIVEGQTGYFIYTRIPYELVYAKVKYFPYGTVNENIISKGKARSYAYKLYNSISKDWNPFAGPEGYIGEALPRTVGEKLYTMVSILKIGEVSPPFDTGAKFAVIKRCRPIQYTFSYIVFPGETGSEETKTGLMSAAEKCIKKLEGSSKEFYSYALVHHKNIKWDAPWYKISKDLYMNRVSRPVYEFLSSSKPGDISKPLVFSNGIYVVMREQLIEGK